MIAYITKYALTQGILIVEGEVDSSYPDMLTVKGTLPYNATVYYHRHEWQRTEEEALERVEGMRKRKIASLEASIKKTKMPAKFVDTRKGA